MKFAKLLPPVISLILYFSGISSAALSIGGSLGGDHMLAQFDRGPGGFKDAFDENRHRGYKKKPYDLRRHYREHRHQGHRYNYRGHWRSWDEWDRYKRERPNLYQDGRYYREGSHLMYRFCEPTGNCFYFSIGG
jgi:hypothetical protein